MKILNMICWCGALLLTVIEVGCASAPPNHQQWASSHGGIVNGAAQARVNAAMGLLAPKVNSRIVPHAYVLGSNSVGAFAWPDGTLFVHRRLLDALDDHELAAALAHELGHLKTAGRAVAATSLYGCDADCDGEMKADACGVELLKAADIDPAAMRSMLTKVDHLLTGVPSKCHVEMRRRIALLPRG